MEILSEATDQIRVWVAAVSWTWTDESISRRGNRCCTSSAMSTTLDANFTDKFMETKFSEEKYYFTIFTKYRPNIWIHAPPSFTHSHFVAFVFEQISSWNLQHIADIFSKLDLVQFLSLSNSLLTVSGVPGVCWPPGPAWKEFKSAFEVKAGLVTLRQGCNLETGHAQTNPPCDPAGRGWEVSRWKLGDPHAYLEQVGALHRPRGHCYLAPMILWGPLRLVSGPRC